MNFTFLRSNVNNINLEKNMCQLIWLCNWSNRRSLTPKSTEVRCFFSGCLQSTIFALTKVHFAGWIFGSSYASLSLFWSRKLENSKIMTLCNLIFLRCNESRSFKNHYFSLFSLSIMHRNFLFSIFSFLFSFHKLIIIFSHLHTLWPTSFFPWVFNSWQTLLK